MKFFINGEKQDNLKYSYYFNQSDNIIELIWNRKLTSTKNMFYKCSDIIELDLSKFDSSKMNDMGGMFTYCSSITSINLSNFNTSLVKGMSSMFNGLSSLVSLNVSSFNTSNANNMCYMFLGCSSLTSLNLSNFDTSKSQYLHSMFSGCKKLEYININYFNDSLASFSNIFRDVPENVIVCILSENDFNKKIFSELKKKKCYTIDCSDDWKANQKKVINKAINECECDFDSCLSCPNLYENISICTNCKIDYYKIENGNSYNGEYFNCYKEINGYYLDKKDSLFKKCYDSCEICETKGDNNNHNCLKCNTNYSYEIKVNNYTNCYENCSYYHYFDNENYYHCTIDLSCPIEYPILIQEKMECTQDTNIYSSYVIKSTEFERSNENEIIKEFYSSEFEISNENEIVKEFYSSVPETSIENEIVNEFYSSEFETFDSNEISNYQTSELDRFDENDDMYQYKSLELELSNLNEIIKEYTSQYIYQSLEEEISDNKEKTINIFYTEELLITTTKIEKKIINIEIKNIIQNIIYEKNKTEEVTKEEEIKYYDTILENIENIFTSENFDSTDIDNGKDEIIKTEKMTITLTTTENQKNNINDNITSIDLGECETLLRNYYNLSNNEILYMKKIDINQEGMNIPKLNMIYILNQLKEN